MSRGTAKYVVRAQVAQAWLIKYCILRKRSIRSDLQNLYGKIHCRFSNLRRYTNNSYLFHSLQPVAVVEF